MSDDPHGLPEPTPAVHPQIARYHAKLEAEAGLARVGRRTWSAMGFGGNINFIEGDDGVIIVNTGSFVEWTRQARDAFREICDKPFVAVIYTHGYSDHTGGVRALIPPGEEAGVEIYANGVWRAYVGQATSPMQPEVIMRGAAQLGWLLPQGEDASVGSALSRYMPSLGSTSYLAPTVSVDAVTRVTIAGVEMELIPAPHDLDDGLMVWMPDEKLLFGGDTLLPGGMYPTIATPRFEPRRDPQKWVETMGLAASYGAEYYIGAYGSYFMGADVIRNKLVGQQKLSQYLIDETARLIFEGVPSEAIAERVTIPPALMEGQDFNDLYHQLWWITRSLIAREFGWFSGDPLDYVRLPRTERAQHMVADMGGADKVRARAADAYRGGAHRWALELATALLAIDVQDARARDIRIKSLKAIAYDTSSTNTRNFLLTSVALETGALSRDALLRAFRGKAPADSALLRPPARVLDMIGPRLRREMATGAPFTARFLVEDRDVTLDITLVDGVMLRDDGGREPDIVLASSYADFIRGAENMTPFAELESAGAVRVVKGREQFDRLIGAFDW
ncbi:MAG: alkyl sulfatase dimerization domain-containing protein [Sphingobium sp.]